MDRISNAGPTPPNAAWVSFARVLAPPLAGLVGVAAILHAAALVGLPGPRPTTDAERTILVHQIESAARATNAQILLVGDSSCLMDVAAADLGREVGRDTVNLGTFSYLGLDEFADLAARALRSRDRAAGPATVVLLLHPRFLRLGIGDDAFVGMYRALASGRVPDEPAGMAGQVRRAAGAAVFRDRIETRLRPFPLPGIFGRHYGFHRGLEAQLAREAGSAIDPGRYRPDPGPASTGIPVASRLERSARGFRAGLGQPVRLLVGITPVPDVEAGPAAAEDHAAALRILREWLDADAVLGNLPATMPAAQFASPTHLDAEGRRAFTDLLARALVR